MVSLHFIAATLFTFVVSGTFVSSQEVITSTSGRKVPVHLIQEHFEKPLTTSDHNKNIIYELTDKKVLQGPNLLIDFESEARPNSRRSFAPRTVIVNGNRRSGPTARLTTLKAQSYKIIVNDESGQILSVTGNGVALAPLHKTEFPGIFVNKRAFSKRDIDLSNDIQLVEEGQDLAKSSDDSDVLVGEVVQRLEGSNSSSRSLADISARQTGSCESGTTHYLEVAVAYDNTFCMLFGNNEGAATQAVQDLIDESNVAYEMSTCIRLALVHVEAHCADPSDPYATFTTFTANQILTGFQNFWISSRADVDRDAAYLVTGFMDGTSTAGIAFVGAACNLRSGYGWVEGARTFVMAHEIGHTVGGNHTPTGIMRATLSSSAQFVFSAQSATEFANFVDNRGGASCMDTTKPPGFSGGTTAPPTTTTTIPIDPAETCAAQFKRNRALTCRRRRLTQINFTLRGEDVGRLRIILVQRNGKFTLAYRTNNRLFISRHRDAVSTDEDAVMDLGDYETQTRRVRRVDSPHEAGELPIPSGARSCCGQDLFIGSSVQVCLVDDGRTLCQTVMDMYTNRVACRNICRGNPSGVFTPASATVDCPSCT